MSSILDALKKLEEEKAARKESRHEPDEFNPDTATEDLVGAGRARTKIALSPAALLVTGGLFALALVVASVGISLALMRDNGAPPATATAHAPAPAPESAPAAAADAPETPAEPIVTEPVLAHTPASATPAPEPRILSAHAPDPEPPAPAPEASAVQDVSPPEPAAPPQDPEPPAAPPVQEPETAASEPLRTAMAETPPVPTPPPASPAAEDVTLDARAAPPPPPAPVPIESLPPAPEPVQEVRDLHSLPLLRPSERARYGLDGLRLNVLREPSEQRPNAQAIINLNKVYVGERIPNSQAILIGVARHGIGVQIVGSGERFYIER